MAAKLLSGMMNSTRLTINEVNVNVFVYFGRDTGLIVLIVVEMNITAMLLNFGGNHLVRLIHWSNTRVINKLN